MGPSKNAALLEDERRGQQLAVVLKAHWPPLKEAELISLLEPKYDQFWSQEDEKKLDSKRLSDPGHIAILETDYTKSNTSAVMLWRVFPRLYRKLPTDLFCPANKIQFDTSATFGVDNIMWSKGFCEELAAFAINPFWTWNAEADFPLMTQLIQLVVRCRTNDCREWRTSNPALDEFVGFVIRVLDEKKDLGWTMKKVMQVALERYKTHHGAKFITVRASEMRRLFQVIVDKAFKAEAAKLTGEYPEEGELYKVTAKDLQLLNKVLAELGPSPDREGLEERIPGSTWKRVMTHARGKKAQSDAVPHDTEDISKVISLSMITWRRKTIIAKRKENGFSHPPGASTKQIGGRVWEKGRPFATSDVVEINSDEESEGPSEDVVVARTEMINTGMAKVNQRLGQVGGKRNRAVSVELGLEDFDDHQQVNEDEEATEEAGYIPSDDIGVTTGKRRRLLPQDSNMETFNELSHSEIDPTETSTVESQATTASKGESSTNAAEVATRMDHGLFMLRHGASSICGRANGLEEEANTTNANSETQMSEIHTLVDGVKLDLDSVQLQVGSLRTSKDNMKAGSLSGAEEQELLAKIKSKLEMMKTQAQFLKENLALEIGTASGDVYDWQAAESKAARFGDTFTVGLDTKLVRWDPRLWKMAQGGLPSQLDVSDKINETVARMDRSTWNMQRKYLHWLARSHKVDCVVLFRLAMDWELTMSNSAGAWAPDVPGVDLGRMVYIEALLAMYAGDGPAQ